MKKLILICLSIMCLLTSAFAQYKHYNDQTKQWKEYPSYEEYIFEESQFIFEGTVIKSEGYWSEEDKMIYTSNIIKIEKIFRGSDKINLGTIEIVTRGGKVADKEYEIKSEQIITGTKEIFFCMYSKYPSSDIQNSNSLRLMALSYLYHCPVYCKNKVMGLKELNSWNEVYYYLGKHKNINIPKEEIQPDKKKDASGSLNDIKKQHEIRYAQNVKNYEKYMQQLQERIAIQQANKSNACKEFFISEYADGPQKNKVIEIYNPSDSIKSLNGYSIKIFNNGAPTPLEIPLSGNVNPKETYVVTHPQADPQVLAKAHQTDVKMNFDGNDAIVLNKGTSTYIDKIGEIGVNPGQAGWNVPPGASTKDSDLRRKHPIDRGETDWNQGKNQWDAFPQDSLGNVKQHQNSCSSIQLVNDLSFSFANPTETGTSPKYFEFDIEVSTNANSTYFDNTVLSIQYNTAAFGTFITTNGVVTVTKGINFNSITYINPNNVMVDDASDVIRIPFGTDQAEEGNLNRTLLSATPQQLFHVKIEIQNCNTNTDLLFVNTFFAENFSTYTLNPTDSINNASFYDGALFPVNQLNNLLCPPPVINTFTSPVYPGTYYDGTIETKHILTIQGSGFGTTRGNGNVYFVNANDPINFPYTPLNANDFDNWTGTQIDIILPSIIDSFPTPTLRDGTPGSGIFYVVTNAGDTVYSNTPIDMPYAIKNAIDSLATNGKLRMDLVNKTDSIGYEFYFGPSITNHPNPAVRAIVTRAVKDWACNTLINIVVKGDTTIDASLPDNVSVIHLVNSFPNNSTLAETTVGFANACGDINSVKHVFPTEIDIAFLTDPSTINAGTWFYDTLSTDLPADNRDFYEIAVHEVGHGNLLSHVNNINDVLFYTGKYDINNTIIGGNRKWIAFNDAEGGKNVVEQSKSIVYNGSCSYKTSTYISSGFSCSGTTIVIEQPEVLNTINVFPNPSSNGFTVNYELTKNTPVQFRMYDYMGKEIKNYNSTIESNGTHQKYIETEGLSNGLYFLVANIGGVRHTMKIIKQ